MAAKNGTLTLGTGPFRKTLSVYASDAAGVAFTFSASGKADANSPNSYFCPAPGMWLMDFCLEAATGQTTSVIYVNDVPVATILNANQLASIQSRPNLGIALRGGDKLTIFQVA